MILRRDARMTTRYNGIRGFEFFALVREAIDYTDAFNALNRRGTMADLYLYQIAVQDDEKVALHFHQIGTG